MSGVRDTFERNKEGLNDLFLKCKIEITDNFNKLLADGQFDGAMNIVNNQISAAILEFEKRRNSVRQILDTKLKLSFDAKNVGLVTEWENAVTTVKSQLEMLADGFKAELKEKLTETVGVPAIEKFLIDAANKKAFTRLPFDFVAKKLSVPENKVEEVAENLIFDGKLPAQIDLVSKMLIFSDVIDKIDVLTPSSGTVPPAPKPPAIPPTPKPQSISSVQPAYDEPQPIDLDSPQPIDISLEPPEPEISEDVLEMPPEALDLPPMDVEESTTDAQTTTALDILAQDETTTPAEPEAMLEATDISEDAEEARSIISFFKSSVEELSEEDRAAARKKRAEKKKKLEEAKLKKLEEAKRKKLEEEQAKTAEPSEGTSSPRTELEKLIKPKAEESPIPPEKAVTCIICQKQVSKEDPTVVSCPHACGAFAHKAELLDKGFCPACNEEVKEVDIEFSTFL